MIQLRPYQIKFIEDIRASIKKHKHIIACAATGSGKSKVFIDIARGSISKNRTVLIISESTSIYNQIHKEIGDTINIGDGIKEFYLEPNKIYVAMAQTLAKRKGLINQFIELKENLLIINDECHVGTSTKLLKQFSDAYLIGFTATPDFRKAKHLPELYKGIVIGPQPQELVEAGYLSPYFHFERQIADLSKLEKSSTGEYTEASQEKVFEKAEVFDGIFDDLKNFTFHKCMIFCASIKHCKDVVDRLRVMYNVSECHSKNPNTEKELFEYTHGSNNICVSVASLTKGFDNPQTDMIILNRATLSLPLYGQMIGRGSRLSPGKSRFTVIDYGRNGTRHKPWNYEHDWQNMWNKKQKLDGVAPVKMCEKCGFIMPVKMPKCPECGHIMIVEPSEKEIKETQLVELTAKYNLLRGRSISTLLPQELFHYAEMTNKKPFAKRIAMSKGNDYLTAYAKFAKWNYGWWNHIIADTDLEYTEILIK